MGLVIVNKIDQKRLKNRTAELTAESAKQSAMLSKLAEENKKLKESLDKLSKDYDLLEKIENKLGCKPGEISPAIPLDEYYKKVSAIVEGKNVEGVAEKIVFGIEVNDDNSVKSPKETFNQAENKRIYTSFQTECPFKGLSKVITRWVRISDGFVAYAGLQPINPTSLNNYIYVEKANGWIEGVYQVELFRGDTLMKIGQGKFTVEVTGDK
jgi:hypothetical protein